MWFNTAFNDRDTPLQPPLQLAFHGEDEESSFTCYSQREVKWSFNGQHLQQKVIASSNSKQKYKITIPNVGIEDRGEYTCRGLAVKLYQNQSSDWFEDDKLIGEYYFYSVDKNKLWFTAIGRLIVGGDLDLGIITRHHTSLYLIIFMCTVT